MISGVCFPRHAAGILHGHSLWFFVGIWPFGVGKGLLNAVVLLSLATYVAAASFVVLLPLVV